MKPNWVCTTCGMWSSRWWNVWRHNNNLHGGNGEIIPYIEYVTGVRSGTYRPARQVSSHDKLEREAKELERKEKRAERRFNRTKLNFEM
ncbi:MAG: hypothetical protein V3T40_01300, partial [Nitrososphaerales archaeon]